VTGLGLARAVVGDSAGARPSPPDVRERSETTRRRTKAGRRCRAKMETTASSEAETGKGQKTENVGGPKNQSWLVGCNGG